MHKITVQAVPNSKQPQVDKIGDNEYRVKIDAPANENKANTRLVEMLAKHFKVPKSSVNIEKRYKKRKIKVIKIK